MTLTPKQRAGLVGMAMQFVGEPYKWAGADPMVGFDCSGLVRECLLSVGALLRGAPDMSAEDIRVRSVPVSRTSVTWGCFAIRPDVRGKAVHIEIVSDILEDGTILSVGASGGDHTTTTAARAIEQGAFVKRRATTPDMVFYAWA